MQIQIHEAGPTATIVMVGRLDVSGAGVVALPLATLSGSKDKLIIDMAGVTFIASIGLRYLTSAARSIRGKGGRLTLRNPAAVVADVIRTSGLMEFLPTECANEPS